MFQQVPLIHLQSKDVIVNVPMVGSEDVLKYTNYLKSWLNTQQKILSKWVESVSDIMFVCAKVSPKQELLDLQKQKAVIDDPTLNLSASNKQKLLEAYTTYKAFLEKELASPTVVKQSVGQSISQTFSQAQVQFKLFDHKLTSVPLLQAAKI